MSINKKSATQQDSLPLAHNNVSLSEQQSNPNNLQNKNDAQFHNTLQKEKYQQNQQQKREVEKLKKELLEEENEFQNHINSKIYFHGTMKDLSTGFDITKSNTAPAIFLSESESFADGYGINRDEDLHGGRTYKARIQCKNTFNFKDKEKIRELRPLLQKLVLDGYTYEPSAIKIVKYPTAFFNGIENPTLEQLVDYYIRRLENGARRMLESPPFIEYLKEKGYNSFTIRESGNDNIAVFNPSLVTFESYKQENGEWIENIHKNHLLSQEYMNFGRLTNDEKERYLKMHEKAYTYYLSGDLQEWTKKKIEAYELLRWFYQSKSDKFFLDSVHKIHWTREIKSLDNILKHGRKIKYDISTEGYYNEEFSSAWGKGIGLKLSGDTLMASNTDLRSDNRIETKEAGSVKKYSYGDNTSIILKQTDFLTHNDLQYHDKKGNLHKGHNEFLINNAKIEAIVIDKTNSHLTEELEQEAIYLANRYNIKIIYNR